MLKKYLITMILFIINPLSAIDLKQSCMDNNATACYQFAIPLTEGENAKVQDIMEEGMSFIRKACILGEQRGCDKMGDQYYKDANYKVALPYLKKSCERGIKSACEAVGTIYRDGHETKPNDTLSRIFYEKACDLKSGTACYNVAIIYRGGFGVDKNRTKEKEFYQKACKASLKVGCDRFTELDNEDKGIETGIIATIKSWFK